MWKYFFYFTFLFICTSCDNLSSTRPIEKPGESNLLLNPEAYHTIAKEAYRQLHFENKPIAANSILKESILKAKSSLQADSFAFYSIYYLLFPDIPELDTTFTRNLVKEIQTEGSSIKNANICAVLYFALNEYYFQQRDALQCFNYAQKIISNEQSWTKDIQILSSLAVARSHELTHDYKSALKNYLKGYYIAEELQIPFYRSLILEEISQFYLRNNLHDKAYEYKLMELDHYGKDSISYYYSKLLKLECIRKINKDGLYDLEEWEQITAYSKRDSIKRLHLFCFAFLRTSLLDASKADKLYEIYTKKYSSDFEQFKKEQFNNYLRLMAAFHESNGSLDSAEYYFELVLNKQGQFFNNPGSVYSFHLRYGDFQLRRGHLNKALESYLIAFDAANLLNLTKHQLIAAKKLKDIYLLKNVDNVAVQFIQQYQLLQDKVDSVQHDRDIVKMEIDNSEQILSLQKRLDEEKLHRIHQNQYNLIAVIIGIVFIILLASVQFHVPIWIIRTLGFLAFILLFEYFIIKLDKQIHHITHEVPWKLFTIKVILFSMLLPFHHWLEKKVVHYLVEKRASGGRFMTLNRQTISEWFSNWNRPN